MNSWNFTYIKSLALSPRNSRLRIVYTEIIYLPCANKKKFHVFVISAPHVLYAKQATNVLGLELVLAYLTCVPAFPADSITIWRWRHRRAIAHSLTDKVGRLGVLAYAYVERRVPSCGCVCVYSPIAMLSGHIHWRHPTGSTTSP